MENENNLASFSLDDREYSTLLTLKFLKRKKYQLKDPSKLTAFIPGLIQKIYVEKGQKVRRGEPLLVLEAMKMKNDVFSPVNGIIKDILVKPGEVVKKNQILIQFELIQL